MTRAAEIIGIKTRSGIRRRTNSRVPPEPVLRLNLYELLL
jgi:hypothetical protein